MPYLYTGFDEIKKERRVLSCTILPIVPVAFKKHNIKNKGFTNLGKDYIMTRKIKSSLLTTGMLIVFGLMLSLTNFGTSSAAELTSGSVRSSANHNPIMDHKFGADPFAVTYNGRVYVYMTNDSQCYDQTPADANGKPSSANKYSTKIGRAHV